MTVVRLTSGDKKRRLRSILEAERDAALARAERFEREMLLAQDRAKEAEAQLLEVWEFLEELRDYRGLLGFAPETSESFDALLAKLAAREGTPLNNHEADCPHAHDLEEQCTCPELERSRTLEARVAELEKLHAWLDAFEAETRALPIQAEDESRGQSAYNWRMWFVREARAALATKPGGGT